MAYCENYIDLISAGLDGALSPAEQKELEAHLTECPACRALCDDLTALRAGLTGLPSVQPPADLTERIMEAVTAEKVVPLPVKKNLQWRKWMASAAVLAIVIAGAWSWNKNSSGSAIPMEAGAGAPDRAEEAAPQASELAQTPEPAADSPASKIAMASEPLPEPASIQPRDAAPEGSYGVSMQSVEPDQSPRLAVQAPASAPAATSTETTREEIPPVAPRLFAAAPPPVENGNCESPEETLYDQNREPLPTDTAEPLPNAFSLTAASTEAPQSVQTLTAQEAVQALANYIYEFVEQVEPMALEEPGAQVWLLSSPTGISGTAALDEETDQLFRFTYRDEEGGEPLCYTVDKTDGKVLFLEQEPSN